MPVVMKDKKSALVSLLDKYAVAYTECQLEDERPVQPWRCNRKYMELQKLVESKSVEQPCLLRFCHLTDAETSFEDLLYREFDLCEFISGHKIVALHAAFTDGCGSVIVRMDNGIIGSVEVGNNLPSGTPEVDRHEIVARRGVASDIAVDTQIPQHSIYLYTDNGPQTYKDIDTELFGLSEKDIDAVRAKFSLLSGKSTVEEHEAQDLHLKAAVAAALESNEKHMKIEL